MNLKDQIIEGAVVSVPLGLIAAFAKSSEGVQGGLSAGLMAGGEGAVAHVLGLMLAGSSYGKNAKNEYYLTADNKETEVAVASAAILGAWVYYNTKSMNGALRSALLVGAMSYLGSSYVLPKYVTWSKSS